MENSDFRKRFIEVCGTSHPGEIAQYLGITYQAAKNYLDKGRLPDSNILLTISLKTPYSIHWLLTGEGAKLAKFPRKKDEPLLTDQMQAFIRQVCLEIFNELMRDYENANRQKVVVLNSEDIKEENVTEESAAHSAK